MKKLNTFSMTYNLIHKEEHSWNYELIKLTNSTGKLDVSFKYIYTKKDI